MSQDPNDRGHHFLAILEEGKRFTSDLLKENEALRLANLKLRDDLREREHQLGQLERLRSQLASIEAENREFADRYLHIEKQNGNLASLYVATYNLHSTLNLDAVVSCIREIVINLIGSEMFGIYVVDGPKAELTLLAHEGLDEARRRTLAPAGVVAEALQSGQAVVADGVSPDGERPIASAPLVIHGQILGVIAIYRLLDHKRGFEAIDRELLDMLAGHAATALYSAKLHAQTERKLTTLQGFIDLLRVRQSA